jgi:hypothetical protein
MNPLRLLAAATAALAITAAYAAPETALAIPARAEITATLNLDAQRARQVEAIIHSAYARMSTVRSQIGTPNDDTSRLALLSAVLTIRYETDMQLATVLTPEEFARMKESLYQPRWDRAMPSRGTVM